jgi:hypothetical protein
MVFSQRKTSLQPFLNGQYQNMPQPVRSRIKACAHCTSISNTLYRVVADATDHWILVCPACRESLSTQPFYRYGGTWKADKRH